MIQLYVKCQFSQSCVCVCVCVRPVGLPWETNNVTTGWTLPMMHLCSSLSIRSALHVRSNSSSCLHAQLANPCRDKIPKQFPEHQVHLRQMLDMTVVLIWTHRHHYYLYHAHLDCISTCTHFVIYIFIEFAIMFTRHTLRHQVYCFQAL